MEAMINTVQDTTDEGSMDCGIEVSRETLAAKAESRRIGREYAKLTDEYEQIMEQYEPLRQAIKVAYDAYRAAEATHLNLRGIDLKAHIARRKAVA